MKQKTDVLQGTLALMVLKTLDVLGPQHGYGIARRIEQISGDMLAVNQGTLYPVLLRLEQEGAIASEWGASENNRRARFYRLTREGRKQLQVETQDWEQTAAIIARFFEVKAGFVMKSLRRFFTRLVSFATRRTQEERLREEIEEHIALQAAENLRAGLPPVEARRQAMLKFGGVEAMKQDYRAERGLPLIEDFLQDLRFALRLLRKSPGFTAVAVATLAIAIGANAVVFGVLNALILRSLNVPQAESLFIVQHGSDVGSHSYPDYLDLRQRNRSFDDVAVFAIRQSGLDTGKDPSNVWQYETSGNYFDVLRIQPYLGRFFHDSDEHGPNSAPYVVLSYAYWHSHFQNDRGVVGRVVRLNRHPFTILGVAPPGFQGTVLFFASDIFVPIVNHEQLSGEKILNAREIHWMFEMVGHLKPGVTPAQATAELNSVDSYLKRAYPKEEGNEPYTLARPGL